MADSVRVYMGGTAYDLQKTGQTFDHGMTDAWVVNAQTQYDAMIAALQEISCSGVPFFVCTDQHGRGAYAQQWMANTDESVRNINLGDYCDDIFGPVRMGELLEQTRMLPNYIGVPGNHDFKKNTETPANYYTINNSFLMVNGRRPNQYGYGTVKDDARNVKYIVIQPYVINLDTTAGFTTGLYTEQAKWLIHELSVDDGYDIVILQHMPLDGPYTNRDGGEISGSDFTSCDIVPMLKNRISGGDGSFTDADGVTHDYDFANLQGRFLCTLHGHMHEELWRIDDGLVSYCADSYANDHCCTLGLIDRANNKLRIWQFGETSVYDELALSIGITETTE